ncbi:hypothetical protein GOV06_04280 [Candidatus Woesearchaeota archaeon]|nr:hypothetical protein [Candidatus Woesearchaeota archaeon]
MDKKTLIKINLVISIILSLYFSIKGAMTHGWFSCMNVWLTDIDSCSFLNWITQIVLLVIVFGAVLTGIEYGIKYLFKLQKRKPEEKEKEEVKEKVEEVRKEIEEKKEEVKEPEKKVIKI